jgi:predicted nucleic acid-binding protein
MILVDTSIWADHFRHEIAHLSLLVANEEVLQHPFVTGELALGNPVDRLAMIRMLEALDQAEICNPLEFHSFIEIRSLGGTGIGFVDGHLLVTAEKIDGVRLWTRDKKLAAQSARLGLSYSP